MFRWGRREWRREKEVAEMQPVVKTGDNVGPHPAFCSDTCLMLRPNVQRMPGRVVGDGVGKLLGAEGCTALVPGASLCGNWLLPGICTTEGCDLWF